MLNISKSQLGEFDQAGQRRFLKRLEGLAHSLRPDLTQRASPENLERFAEFVNTQARSIGFTTEFEIAVFCAATLLQGKDFHLNPSHPLFMIIDRDDVAPRLKATQLLYELEQLTEGKEVAS